MATVFVKGQGYSIKPSDAGKFVKSKGGTYIEQVKANIISTIGGGGRRTSFAVPATLATGGLRGAGTAIKGAKNFIARAFTNPFAGVTIKEGFRNLGKRILGTTITGAGAGLSYGLAKETISGDAISPKDVLQSGLIGTSYGINPFGALTGTSAGFIDKGMSIGKDVISDIPRPNMPTVDKMPFPEFDYPDFSMPDFSMPQFPTGINVGMPSFNPSVSVGGGGGGLDPTLLLLLLGGAGLGAYALGKRKRKKKSKKKKYKKRRAR